MSLKGKTVVVTGASKGLGLGIVKRLAAEGADIVAHYNSGDISEARKAAEEAGVGFKAYQADLSKADECVKLAESIIAENDVYGLVNNAGVCIFEDYFGSSIENFDLMFAVNIRSVFILTQKIAQDMAKKGIKGRVINFSSIAAESGSASQVHYGASKGAVVSFTKAAAVDLGKYGITVNALRPGPIRTAMNYDYLDDEKNKKEICERLPLGRYGMPENIADIVAYLLGEGANWTTGAIFDLDGGYLCV